MAVDAFTVRLGTEQGRVLRDEADPGSGEHAFVLGSRAFRTHELAVGDFVEVWQEVSLSGESLIRVEGEARVPAGPPGSLWELSLRVDREVRGRLLLRPGRTRPLADLAANVSRDEGTRRVAARMQLLSVGEG